jgi:hypothetical protein
MSDDKTAFPVLGDELLETLGEALPKLQAMSAADAAKPYAPGKWSSTQVIGHLIDSAANNHQRFIRAQAGPLVFPPYIQDEWVAAQHYEDRSWDDLVAFWYAYNRHLAHVMRHIPEDKRSVAVTIGAYDPVTLGFLAHDYIVHMRQHLKQIGALA